MSHCSGSGDITPTALRTAAYDRLLIDKHFYFSPLLSCTCVNRCFVNGGRIEKICLPFFSAVLGLSTNTRTLPC